MYVGGEGIVVGALVPATKSRTISNTPVATWISVTWMATECGIWGHSLSVNVGKSFTFSVPGFHSYKITVEPTP